MSLRARLTLIILGPLLVISLLVSLWALRDAQIRASEQFDRSLLSAILSISRDTALSGGDALSESTRDLISGTSGGPVFYHVYAPDGVFVTGYATPPVPPSGRTATQLYYDGVHQGRSVRALRMTDVMSIDNLHGEFTFTVWQDLSLRDAFVRDLTQRTSTVIASLVLALTLIVWFGVRIGLRPLLDLQGAIARRSPDELLPIRRRVPVEVQGTVGTLNTLLGQLGATFKAKDDFIANAAHQLRNPLAGVLAMAGAVQSATTLEDAKVRSQELIEAARSASNLANALLTLERARSPKKLEELENVDLLSVCRSVADKSSPTLSAAGVQFDVDLMSQPICVKAERVLLEQSILNLIDNAVLHGGQNMTFIRLQLRQERSIAMIEVVDDGEGMHLDETSIAIERFGQLKQSQGSGLGLSIVDAAARAFGGTFELVPTGTGLTARLKLPIPPENS